MGNVPAKESRSRSSSLAVGDSSRLGYNGYSAALSSRGSRRHTLSESDAKRLQRQQDKEHLIETHLSDLVVRYDQFVDGGYLAPFGTYRHNLDYDTSIVRLFILKRKLAPLYTPLQDFDQSWLDEELYAILRLQGLHAIEDAYDMAELLDDPDDHKINKLNNFRKRKEQKERLKVLQAKALEAQRQEEARFSAAKRSNTLPMIPSKDLLLALYRNCTECPICFLYYPPWLNQSRCCGQPICTECFVQIKRMDPHAPHDDNGQANSESSATVCHALVSEPAQCPYCALPDFGVTYIATPIRAGILSLNKPLEYTNVKNRPADESMDRETKQNRPRHVSVSAQSDRVITIDHIRPNWEHKLTSARNKRARRAAAASAIHASNMLIGDENSPSPVTRPHIDVLEQQMLEQALQLSLADENERQRLAIQN